MAKKLIQRYLPNNQSIREHQHLKWLGGLLQDANLWHLNRRSVSGAFAVGLLMAFVPVPFQMVLAALAAILVRVNLPISVALVWITNPITIPPMFYFCYRVGTWLLHVPPTLQGFELSQEWLLGELSHIWQPLLLGCAVVGILSAAIGYFVVRLVWRWYAVRQWQLRPHAKGFLHRRHRPAADPTPEKESKPTARHPITPPSSPGH